MPQGHSKQTPSSSNHLFQFTIQATAHILYTLHQPDTIYQQVYFTTTKMSYTAFLTAAISLMMTLAVAQPVPVPTDAETVKVDVSHYNQFERNTWGLG